MHIVLERSFDNKLNILEHKIFELPLQPSKPSNRILTVDKKSSVDNQWKKNKWSNNYTMIGNVRNQNDEYLPKAIATFSKSDAAKSPSAAPFRLESMRRPKYIKKFPRKPMIQ
jgi:hypothetical protein